VVLGTGWGAHAFLKSVDATKQEVVVVSPREYAQQSPASWSRHAGALHVVCVACVLVSPGNFMLFTPMLAGAAVGTVEYRSITEVRGVLWCAVVCCGIGVVVVWHGVVCPPAPPCLLSRQLTCAFSRSPP
jgi:NADH dehydrogenase FAD-containing subunit